MSITRKSLIAITAAAVAGFAIHRAREKAAPPAAQSRTTAGTIRPEPRSARAASGKVAAKSLLKPRLDDAGKLHLQQNPGSVLTDHDGGNWTWADDDLLVAWAAQNPNAAMAWVNRGDHSVIQAQLLGAVAAGILLRDGKEAMRRFLEEHQQDPNLRPKDQGNLETYLFLHLGRADTIDAAMELLAESTDGNLAGAIVTGIQGARHQANAIDYMDAKGHPVAMDYGSFQAQINDNPRFWADWALQRDSGMMEDILQSWGRDHPDQVREWIDRNVPKGDKRRAAIDELMRIQATGR